MRISGVTSIEKLKIIGLGRGSIVELNFLFLQSQLGQKSGSWLDELLCMTYPELGIYER